jgi:hypothetical protein
MKESSLRIWLGERLWMEEERVSAQGKREREVGACRGEAEEVGGGGDQLVCPSKAT